MIIRIDGLLECPDGRRSAALSYNDGAHTAVALQFNSDDDPAAAALCTIMHCNENLSVFWWTPFKQICSDLPPQEVSLRNGNWPNGDQWDGRRKVWTGGRKGWTVNWFQLIPQLMSPPWVSMSPPWVEARTACGSIKSWLPRRGEAHTAAFLHFHTTLIFPSTL